ncbi:MAG: zinc-binding alcohol dehydrogenase family protein [Bacteroidetes bacterium]|nr:zinc-binding alcohol dehydrogenase family protein [Bacteroidota bacterium]
MKAVVINTPGDLRVKEIDTPSPAPGEVLLQMLYVGFCGSDLSTYLGKNPMVNYPRIPGHEISGVIAELGEDIPDAYKVGDAVTVVPYTNCGDCPSCRRGRTYACRENQTLGVQREGAMQEYITLPWQKILPAPNLNELELAMVEPLTVGFHAIQRGRVEESDVVMVLGCGMIGAGAIASAALRGATVIAVDIDEHKLELASALGAQHTINSLTSDLHSELEVLSGGDGPDVVVEAAGNPLTYRAAVDEVAFTGRVICIGYAGTEVSFATKLFVQKEIDIMGSRNAAQEDFAAVISYLEQGTFPLDLMITRKVKPAYAAMAVKQWADNPGKVMKILLDFKS